MSAVATAPIPSTRLMTAEEFFDFVNLPENEHTSFELVRGRVVEMSRPTVEHGVVQSNVAFELKLYARTNKFGYVFVESGVLLEQDPDTVRGPDVAFFAESTRFEDLPSRWATLPPLLAVEVLSANDRPGLVSSKIKEYLDHGTRMVWLVDIDNRTVTIHRQGHLPLLLKELQVLAGMEELPGFSCPVHNLFLNDFDQPT